MDRRCFVALTSASAKSQEGSRFDGSEAMAVLLHWNEFVDMAIDATAAKSMQLWVIRCFLHIVHDCRCRKRLGMQWRRLYDVLQTRVTAGDTDSDPDLVKCSCCRATFTPHDIPLNGVSHLRHRAHSWKGNRELRVMCSTCASLQERARKAIRQEQRVILEAERRDLQLKGSLFDPEVLQERKLKKAQRLQALAMEFSKAIKGIIPQRHTFYLHALVWHFPEWIRTLPMDIMDASGSGIEQVNQMTKRLYR
jgi:hypothetical protein